jgi:hypothetical protein
MDFIESKKISYDESTESLIKEMEKEKDAITKIIGQEKYDEEMDVLKKIMEQEEKEGLFK